MTEDQEKRLVESVVGRVVVIILLWTGLVLLGEALIYREVSEVSRELREVVR